MQQSGRVNPKVMWLGVGVPAYGLFAAMLYGLPVFLLYLALAPTGGDAGVLLAVMLIFLLLLAALVAWGCTSLLVTRFRAPFVVVWLPVLGPLFRMLSIAFSRPDWFQVAIYVTPVFGGALGAALAWIRLRQNALPGGEA